MYHIRIYLLSYTLLMTSFVFTSQQLDLESDPSPKKNSVSHDQVSVHVLNNGARVIEYTDNVTYSTVYSTFPDGGWKAKTIIPGEDNFVETEYFPRINYMHHVDSNKK